MPVESLLKDPALDSDTIPLDYRKYAEKNLSAFPVYITGNQIIPPQGHQKYANNVPSKSEIEGWMSSQKTPQAFGLAMGKTYDADNRLVCIDVDHPGLVRSIQNLYPTPCARFGSKGIGLFYRVDRNDKDMKKSVNMMIPGRNSPAVEYLSVGRFTFIPPSIHRKTGDRYKWVGAPLLTVIDQLPLLTAKDLRIIQTIVGLDVDGATIENLTAGEGTHYATLSLCGALVARGLDQERIIRAVELLFPPDYQGDTTRQIPEMVESAFRKGFDKKQNRPSDGGDIDEEDLSEIFADWHYVTNNHSIRHIIQEAKKWKPKGEKAEVKSSSHSDQLFTQREVEILKWVSQGMKSAEIGDKMNIDVRTVETHRRNIIEKTPAKNMIGAVLWAFKEGWIEL